MSKGTQPVRHKVTQTFIQEMFIRAVRDSGIPIVTIADMIGVRRMTVSDLINGWQNGSLPMWQKILDACEVELDYRIGDDEGTG